MKPFTVLWLLGIAVASCAGQAEAQQGKLPYAGLYQAVSGTKVTINGEEASGMNTQIRIVVTSKLPNVKPQDITLYIDSKTGRIPLVLSSDGTLTLPFRADLMEENPFIVSNQPKGSLGITGSSATGDVASPPKRILSAQHKARYRDLFMGESMVAQTMVHATKTTPEVKALRDKTASCFEFTPTQSTNAPAVIDSTDGVIRIVPDQHGVIRVIYDPKLAQENPWVTFPSDGSWKTVTQE